MRPRSRTPLPQTWKALFFSDLHEDFSLLITNEEEESSLTFRDGRHPSLQRGAQRLQTDVNQETELLFDGEERRKCFSKRKDLFFFFFELNYCSGFLMFNTFYQSPDKRRARSGSKEIDGGQGSVWSAGIWGFMDEENKVWIEKYLDFLE